MYQFLRDHLEAVSPLTDEEFEYSSSHFKLRKLKKHACLIQENDYVEYEYFVVKGCLRAFEEISNERPGSQILIDRLAELLFVHTMRAYLSQSTSVSGFLSAFKDGRTRKVLKNIHNFPEKQWTLELMSTDAGMSRTLFFNTFKALVGETPQCYLTNWRIGKAKEILSSSKANVRVIAAQVDYQSEAAFNRTFKLKVNETPASYRKNSGVLGSIVIDNPT